MAFLHFLKLKHLWMTKLLHILFLLQGARFLPLAFCQVNFHSITAVAAQLSLLPGKTSLTVKSTWEPSVVHADHRKQLSSMALRQKRFYSMQLSPLDQELENYSSRSKSSPLPVSAKFCWNTDMLPTLSITHCCPCTITAELSS